MKQVDLEKDMAEAGRNRYRSSLNKARTKGNETRTSGAQRVLQHAIGYYDAGLREWMKEARKRPGVRHTALEYLQKLPSAMVAALAARALLDGIASANKMTRVAVKIGSVLEDEVYHREFERQDAVGWKHAKKKAKAFQSYEIQRRMLKLQGRDINIDFDPWPIDVKVKVGSVLIDLFSRYTGLVRVEKKMDRHRTVHELVPTEAATRALELSHQDAEIMAPIYMPCIQEPKPWVNPMVGGFLSADLYRRALVKTTSRAYLNDLTATEMPEVYRAVNALQSTPFQIHDQVLGVLEDAWAAGRQLPDMPHRGTLPLPPKPPGMSDDPDLLKEWKKSARAIHDANHRGRQQRLRMAKILQLANRFSGDPLWFVQQLDFRARTYCNSYYMHPQGSDACKGLLRFANAKPVATDEAVFFFYLHGANCWGLDKRPYAERVQWVKDEAEMICRIAEDPTSNRQWEDCDAPWQFLAWAFEFRAWIYDRTSLCGVPIAQDATQSGIQILSMLLRDERGARATNCIPADEPQDLYQQVADETIGLVQQAVGGPDDIMAQFWLSFGISRKTTKRPTMTRVYNATIFSCRDYVAEWFRDEMLERGMGFSSLPGEKTFTQTSCWLAARVWEALNNVTTSSKVVMDWLSEVADVFTAVGQPIRWITPTNFLVEQHYRKTSKRVVSTRLGAKIRYHTLAVDLDTIEPRRSRQALAPNFIHSMDAAAMMRTVNIALDSGVTDFCMVHDSYATTAADAHLMYAACRESFAGMFSPDVLTDIREQFVSQLPLGTDVPELPPFGTFDPAVIRQSPYFFC